MSEGVCQQLGERVSSSGDARSTSGRRVSTRWVGSPEVLRSSPEVLGAWTEVLRGSPEVLGGSPELLRAWTEALRGVRRCWGAPFEVLRSFAATPSRSRRAAREGRALHPTALRRSPARRARGSGG